MKIVQDNLTHPEVIDLLRAHLANMHAITPPGSVHALDVDALRAPDVTFWSAWEGEVLAGCGALKELSRDHGEIKSMRTADAFRRRGVAAELLTHILAVANERGYARLSLETGSQAAFAPARQLYARFGFEPSGPFGTYDNDPNSAFMSRCLKDD